MYIRTTPQMQQLGSMHGPQNVVQLIAARMTDPQNPAILPLPHQPPMQGNTVTATVAMLAQAAGATQREPKYPTTRPPGPLKAHRP